MQINKSCCGALLNAIQLLDRSQSTELAKEKRGVIASENPLMALVNPSGWGDFISAALNWAIAPKLKVTCNKSSPGFYNLPPNRFGDRQNPFIQR